MRDCVLEVLLSDRVIAPFYPEPVSELEHSAPGNTGRRLEGIVARPVEHGFMSAWTLARLAMMEDCRLRR